MFNFNCSSQPTTKQHEKGNDIAKYEIDKLTYLILAITNLGYIQKNWIQNSLSKFIPMEIRKNPIIISYFDKL